MDLLQIVCVGVTMGVAFVVSIAFIFSSSLLYDLFKLLIVSLKKQPP
jgi:hypothetical protein